MDGAREGVAQALRRVSNSVRGVANGDTEDVVQEAVARALKSGVSLEAEQWLRTVAKRVAIDKHRRRRETPSGAPSELEQWAPPTGEDPEDFYIRGERQRAVREAMAALPPRYQKALMAYAEEDSPAAVAARLGLSSTATWTLLSRARSRLKLQLEQTGFVPAMFMSNGRPRLRTLLAAGAVAATATTAVVVPKVILPTDNPPPAKQVVSTQKSEPVVKKPAVKKPAAVPDVALPVKPPKVVTDKVDEVVSDDGVETVLSAKACIGPDGKEIGAEIGVVKEKAPTVAELLGLVPEPIREPLAITCASKSAP